MWMNREPRRLGLVTTVSIALAMLCAVLVPAVAAAAPSSAPSAAVAPASGSPYQWAFGGSLSSVYSCTGAVCPNGTSTTDEVTSLSWNIGASWVVIYTETNVSLTQTELELETGVSVSASFSEAICETTSPCVAETLSFSVSGHELSAGYTNVTPGTVTLTAGPDYPGSPAAVAVLNAASHEAFNISGNIALKVPEGPVTETINENFDLGGSESAQIAFSSPLGIVPTDPSVGDNWTASEPFTASGHYISGYSLSGDINGTSASASHWAPGTVAASGTLEVNGTDNGTRVLYDNYTSPAKTITVQEIYLTFSGGNFTASDGLLFSSSDVYSTIFSGLSGDEPAGPGGPAVAAPGLSLGGTNAESTFYAAGPGFVGANVAGNLSSAASAPGAPSLALNAGPEPVSVAQTQYSAIASPSSGGGGFPLLLVAGIVVAAVVVVALVMLLRGRSKRPAGPSSTMPPPGAVSAPMPPSPPAPPQQGAP